MAKRRRTKQDKLFRILTSIVVVLSLLLVTSVIYMLQKREKEAEETPMASPFIVHNYDWVNLSIDGSYATYTDANYKSLQGIDVSAIQNEIDWAKVKAAGIDFAFIRVGYRGYTEGNIYEDSYFHYNIQQAIANDIQVGVYFFSQAIDTDEAREEAEFTLNLIKDYQIDLPVVYDIEKPGEGMGRVDNLSREVWTQNAVTFLHIIRNAGYEPMIYNSTNLFERYFNLEYLQEFDTWVAEYNVSNPNYPYAFSIWQYSSTGQVDGISTNVDMDIMFVEK